MKLMRTVRGIAVGAMMVGGFFILPATSTVLSSPAGASGIGVTTSFSCQKGWIKVADATNLCSKDETKTVAQCNKSFAQGGGTWIGGKTNNCYVEKVGITKTIATSFSCQKGWIKVADATNLCSKDETKTVAQCNKSFAQGGGTWIGGKTNNCYVEKVGITARKVTY